MNEAISGAEFMFWYCQLRLHGYSPQEAKQIVLEVMDKVKEASQ